MSLDAAIFDDLVHAGAPPEGVLVCRGGAVYDRAENAKLEFWTSAQEDLSGVYFMASGPPWLLCAAELVCRVLEPRDLAPDKALDRVLTELPPPADRRSLGLLLEDALTGLRDALAKTA